MEYEAVEVEVLQLLFMIYIFLVKRFLLTGLIFLIFAHLNHLQDNRACMN